MLTPRLAVALLIALLVTCVAPVVLADPTTRPSDSASSQSPALAVPPGEMEVKTSVDETAILGGGRDFTPATPQTVRAVTETVFPAVVSLDVKQEVYRQGKRELRAGIGSGVIIDDRGHILTNYHVAGRAAELFVTLANKERVRATLVGDDHWTDLAVVRMDLDELRRKNATFVYATLGESHSLVPGQDVIAIGTPFGLARTLTLGVVSNTERTFYPDRQRIDEYETGDFANWIQMDTPIAPGNSGGPLVDLDATVVGINTRGIEGQNLNFAIPIDVARAVAAEILASGTTERKGRVERADLGIDLKPLQDLEAFYRVDVNRGVLVNSVRRNGPAASAGLRTQDVLLSVAGEPTNVRFPEELAPVRARLSKLPVGEAVDVTVLRGGQEVTMSVTPERLQGAVGEERELSDWGLSVRDVTPAYAADQQLESSDGVVITTISTGYPAARADLRRGDVILSIDRQPVADLEAMLGAYDERRGVDGADKANRVLVELRRGRGRQSAVLRLD